MDTIITPNPVIPEPKKASGFLPTAIKSIRIIALFILGFVLFSVLLAFIFEKQIGQKLITLLNESLETEVQVQDFDLSLLRHFPRASARLNSVSLPDLNQKTLLQAESVSFDLSIMSLFGGQTEIPSVKISDGRVNLEISKNGEASFKIIKAKDSNSNSNFSIALNKAILENVNIIYTDHRGPQTVDIDVQNASISGLLTGREFDLDIDGEFISKHININNHKYLADKPASVKAKMHIDLVNRIYSFRQANFNLEGNPLLLGGKIQTTADATDFDLQFLSKKGNIATLIGFLPKQYSSAISDFKSSGDFNMVAKIKGPLSNRQNPAIDILFGIEKGAIKSKRFGQSIKRVNFKGKFTNGLENRNRTSLIQIKDFSGSFRGEPLDFDLSIKNLDRPFLSMTLDGKLATSDIVEMIDSPVLTKGIGAIRLKNMGIKGALEDLTNPARMTRAVAKGHAELMNLAFELNNEKIQIEDGRFMLQGNKLSISNLKMNMVDSDINLSGNCYNLIPVLFADSTHKDDIRLRFDGALDSKNLDLDALTQLFSRSVSEPAESTVPAKDENQFLTSFLQGSFSAKVNQFHYNKIKGKDFEGDMEIDDNEIMIEGNANGMGGNWILNGTVFLEEKINADARVSCQGIDLKEFFLQSNNFGQKVLESRHVEGTLMANLKIVAFWEKNGSFSMDDLHVLGDVAIANGALDNFEMLKSFSKYIKSEDLRHVKFTTMRNWLEVKDRKISIPNMFVQSNALNIELCGLHTFENKMDYNFKVNAGQVFINRFKKYNPHLVPVRAQREGLINLHYRVYGAVENYQVKSDVSYVKRRLSNSMAKKIRIQNTLSREFGDLDIPEDHAHLSPPYFQKEKEEEVFIDDPVETAMESTVDETIEPVSTEEASTEKDNGFRIEDIFDKSKDNEKKDDFDNWPESNTQPEEEEFLDFEIEGKNLNSNKDKKPGGN